MSILNQVKLEQILKRFAAGTGVFTRYLRIISLLIAYELPRDML